jgi:uncharacterized protein
MFRYQGRTALITGASSGIGKAFAQELAKRKVNVVLVARSEDKLRLLGAELHQTYGVRAEVIAADLSQAGAALKIYEIVRHRQIDIDFLINNAGFLNYGAFEEIPAAQDHQQIMLNVAALVNLTHAFMPLLLAHDSSAIINVSSSGAFQPMPYMAVYGASKAFVLSFSEALWAEYQGRGLRVLALCPGPTKTSALVDVFDNGKATSPDQVVRAALKALEKEKIYVIPGFGNFLLANTVPRLLPRSIVARILEGITRPRHLAYKSNAA